MLVENSDEPYAEEIAATVFKWQRKGKNIETTTDMKNVIEEALVYVPKAEKAEAVKKSCQRTFQALRIDVNSEFEVLYTFLDKLPEIMVSGGRIAILTFHSGEDRLVKRSFKQLKKQGIYILRAINKLLNYNIIFGIIIFIFMSVLTCFILMYAVRLFFMST